MNTRQTLGCALAVIALLLSACGGSGGGGGDGTSKTTTTVGAAGGTVTGPDGMRVEIPAGALDGNVEIGVKVSSAGAPALPEEADPTATVYELTPHGIQFKLPVTISVPSTADPAFDPVVMKAEQAGEGWITVNATQAAGRVSWQVLGFSYWTTWNGSGGQCASHTSNDPYMCARVFGEPTVAAQPAAAMTPIPYAFYNYRLSEEADVSITINYTVPRDCTINPRVKVVHWSPDELVGGTHPRTTIYDAPAVLTTVSNDGLHLSGVASLPAIQFRYPSARHYHEVLVNCRRTYNNALRQFGGFINIHADQMAASAAPVITQQPANQTVTAPATATFTAASDKASATIQWQRSNDGGATWADIPGATSASYTTAATSTADSGAQFHAVFTNATGPTPTNAATLTVNPTPAYPVYVTQPASQSVTIGATATFSVSVTGTPAPSLQWQVSTDGGATWSDIPGATGSSYTTPATGAGDSGNRYQVVATNASGTEYSASATLTVSAALALQPYGKISAFSDHVCAVTATGQLHCWGQGFSGQLGNGGSTSSTTPVPVSNLTNVEFVAAGGYDTCAIHGGGQLSCWGFWSDSLTPRPMGVSNAAWVTVGANHVCHVNTGGEIWCWGENGGGQLGDGTQIARHRTNPVQVKWSNGTAVTGAVSVAAGATYTCAKMSGGEVYCWGMMYETFRLAPERLVRLLPNGTTTDFTITGHIAGSMDHACAVESSGGQTVCWGYNTYGYLGDNDVTGRDTAVAVGASGIGNVAAGQYHSCSLDSATGTSLTCWGRTYFGNGGGVVTLPYPQTAGRVSSYYNNSTAISAAAAGSDFTCALLKTSGDVQCWGSGGGGQIGNGGTSNALTPTSTSAGAIFWH